MSEAQLSPMPLGFVVRANAGSLRVLSLDFCFEQPSPAATAAHTTDFEILLTWLDGAILSAGAPSPLVSLSVAG